MNFAFIWAIANFHLLIIWLSKTAKKIRFPNKSCANSIIDYSIAFKKGKKVPVGLEPAILGFGGLCSFKQKSLHLRKRIANKTTKTF